MIDMSYESSYCIQFFKVSKKALQLIPRYSPEALPMTPKLSDRAAVYNGYFV